MHWHHPQQAQVFEQSSWGTSQFGPDLEPEVPMLGDCAPRARAAHSIVLQARRCPLKRRATATHAPTRGARGGWQQDSFVAPMHADDIADITKHAFSCPIERQK